MKLRKKIEEYDELMRLKKEATAYLSLYEDDRMKPVLGIISINHMSVHPHSIANGNILSELEKELKASTINAIKMALVKTNHRLEKLQKELS